MIPQWRVGCQNSCRASDLGFYSQHSCSFASSICSWSGCSAGWRSSREAFACFFRDCRRDDERDVAVSVGSDAWNDGQTTVTTILKQPGITGSQAPKPVEFDDRDNSRSPNVTSEETARYRHHACRVFAGLRPRARTTMTLTPSGSAEDPFSTA